VRPNGKKGERKEKQVELPLTKVSGEKGNTQKKEAISWQQELHNGKKASYKKESWEKSVALHLDNYHLGLGEW